MSQTIIITGASRGIGAATARAAAARGARLCLTGRSGDALSAVADQVRHGGGEALVVAGDVTEAGTCERVVEATLAAFGAVDALVNNAGVVEPIAPLAECDPAAWERNIAVNVVGPAWMTRFALPALRRARGRVVQISSGAAVRAVRGWSAYCTSKAALNHFNRVLAEEEPDVTAVAFSPGMTATDMQDAVRRDGAKGMPAEVLERFVEAHREGALRPPADVGRAVAALALDAPAAWSGEFMDFDDARVGALVEKFGS